MVDILGTWQVSMVAGSWIRENDQRWRRNTTQLIENDTVDKGGRV
jgi:hypothetical protein